MNKIETSSKDYQSHGMGFNNYNFCKNIFPKISTWMLTEYNDLSYKDFDEIGDLAEKLEKIVTIINEEELENNQIL